MSSWRGPGRLGGRHGHGRHGRLLELFHCFGDLQCPNLVGIAFESRGFQKDGSTSNLKSKTAL